MTAKEEHIQAGLAELLAFIKDMLSDISKDKLSLFKGFLKDAGIKDSDMEGVKVEDDLLKDAIKSIQYDKKVKDALKQAEPPAHVNEYINKTIKDAKSKIEDFFKVNATSKKNFAINDRFDHSFSVTASRGFFDKDERIMPNEQDTYEFELSCYYRKEKPRLEITLYSQFKVKEDCVTSVGSDNFVLFDKFAQKLGFKAPEKSVQFSAVISDGEVSYNNDCDAYWTKHINME